MATISRYVIDGPSAATGTANRLVGLLMWWRLWLGVGLVGGAFGAGEFFAMLFPDSAYQIGFGAGFVGALVLTQLVTAKMVFGEVSEE